jgi:hypothetical protein
MGTSCTEESTYFHGFIYIILVCSKKKFIFCGVNLGIKRKMSVFFFMEKER